jgi:hypothetical protein
MHDALKQQISLDLLCFTNNKSKIPRPTLTQYIVGLLIVAGETLAFAIFFISILN